MQIDQLFEFVYVLIDKKQVTASDMSKRFGVSTRTIYRWLETAIWKSVLSTPGSLFTKDRPGIYKAGVQAERQRDFSN